MRGWWQVVRSEERGAHHDERGAASARVEPDACVLVLASRKVDALLCRERHAARAWVRVGARVSARGCASEGEGRGTRARHSERTVIALSASTVIALLVAASGRLFSTGQPTRRRSRRRRSCRHRARRRRSRRLRRQFEGRAKGGGVRSVRVGGVGEEAVGRHDEVEPLVVVRHRHRIDDLREPSARPARLSSGLGYGSQQGCKARAERPTLQGPRCKARAGLGFSGPAETGRGRRPRARSRAAASALAASR